MDEDKDIASTLARKMQTVRPEPKIEMSEEERAEKRARKKKFRTRKRTRKRARGWF